MTRTRQVLIFALSATVFLLAWAAWRAREPEAEPGVPGRGSCEARCLARDPDCAELAAAEGGYPDPTLEEADRRAMCNGLCYVMRRKATSLDNACLAR